MNRIEICLDKSTKAEQEFYNQVATKQQFEFLGRTWNVKNITKHELDDGNTYLLIESEPGEAVKKYPLAHATQETLNCLNEIKKGVEDGVVSSFGVAAITRLGEPVYAVCPDFFGCLIAPLDLMKQRCLEWVVPRNCKNAIQEARESKEEVSVKTVKVDESE